MIQAKINEAISDVAEPNVKVRYFPLTVLFGRPESEEGLKEAEDTFQASTSTLSIRSHRTPKSFLGVITINRFLVCDLRFSGDNTFLVDDKFSLADVVLATLLSMAVVVGQYDLSKKFPKLQKFYDGVLKQPAYAKIEEKLMAFLATDEMQAMMKNRKRVTKF